MRTIRVTGKGMIKVRPNMTRLTITLEDTCKEYEETLKKSSENTDRLKTLLEGFGFGRADIKTLSFNVEEAYESYGDGPYNRKKLVGYKYDHRVKVEFDSDNARLGKIVYALAHSDLHPEFRISYTVKDPEAAKNELLGRAVKDSLAKAAVLTEVSGTKLKEIQSIDYSWGEIDLEVRPMRSMCYPAGLRELAITDGGFDYDLEPDDIELTDTVTVVWEIE